MYLKVLNEYCYSGTQSGRHRRDHCNDPFSKESCLAHNESSREDRTEV